MTFGPHWTVTPKVAASLLGLTERRVRHLMEHHDLDVHHEGQYRLIPLDSLFAYRRRLPPRHISPDKENHRDR